VRRLDTVLTLALTLGLLACTAAPRAAPSAERSQPAGTAVGPQAGAVRTGAQGDTGGAQAGWQAEWERTLAAARQEGSVVVYGPPGDLIRRNMLDGFRKAYPDIALEWAGGRSAEHATKLEAERRAGLYAVDVFVAGTTTALAQVKPLGALDPIGPALILPEVTDPANWLGNHLDYADEGGELNLAFINVPSPLVLYDPRQVRAEDVDELYELLDPRWAGKLVIADPTPSGNAQLIFRFIWEMLGPEKGAEYIRAVRAQAATVDRDLRRPIEWVARGRYPLLLGPSSGVLEQLAQEGLQANLVVEFKDYGTPLSTSFGSLMRIQPAPHPNAAKVFINWLLGREGQTAYSLAMNQMSRRVDVPQDHLPPEAIVRADGKYWPSYYERHAKSPPALTELLQAQFGR
jgi:iron(III) transport system substrate-binding protein